MLTVFILPHRTTGFSFLKGPNLFRIFTDEYKIQQFTLTLESSEMHSYLEGVDEDLDKEWEGTQPHECLVEV